MCEKSVDKYNLILTAYGFKGGGDWTVFDEEERVVSRYIALSMGCVVLASPWEISFGWFKDGPLMDWGVRSPKVRLYRSRQMVDCKLAFPYAIAGWDRAEIQEHLGSVFLVAFDKVLSRLKDDLPMAVLSEIRNAVLDGVGRYFEDMGPREPAPGDHQMHRCLRNYLDLQELKRLAGEPDVRPMNVGKGFALVPDPMNAERVLWIRTASEIQ